MFQHALCTSDRRIFYVKGERFKRQKYNDKLFFTYMLKKQNLNQQKTIFWIARHYKYLK